MKQLSLFLMAGLILTSQFSGAQDFPKFDESFRLKQLEPPKGKVRMVLDTDAYNEIDDQFALVYAYLSPDKIELEAVYAAPFLNSRSKSPADGMEKSYEEILRLLKLLGKSPDGFAFRGSDRWLEDVSKPVRSEAALDLIKKARSASPENPLYVVPVGVITNVASAMLIAPDIIENIVVVWLGGHDLNWPDQRGFNLRQDVKAAQVVFNSGVPFVHFPMRAVTSHFHTTIPELEYFLKGKNRLSDYLLNITIEYSAGRDTWSKVLWDVTCVAWLVNPSWVPTNVVHSPILTDQVTFSTDLSRHFIRIATWVDRDAIFRDMFKKIAGAK